MTTVIASALLAALIAYGMFAGADFGTGLWDLTAGGACRGARARHLIDHAIGPVWEANHVWLIFVLVLSWTGFPTAFVAVTTTLYIPLGIAAFGIVLRGSGFAFRKVALRTADARVNGIAFATSSVLTPFCFGAVAGGLASGRVPTGGHGDAMTSWLNPTSAIGGVLAVATCGYLAALFLTAQAYRLGDVDLERWARRRTVVSAIATGATALVGLFVLHDDAHRLFDRLLHVGWPLVALSALAGTAALLCTGLPRLRARPPLVRPLGVIAVASILGGWAAGQYPYLLGTHLDVHDAEVPHGTLHALAFVGVGAAVLIVPSLTWLFTLTERERLTDPHAINRPEPR